MNVTIPPHTMDESVENVINIEDDQLCHESLVVVKSNEGGTCGTFNVSPDSFPDAEPSRRNMSAPCGANNPAVRGNNMSAPGGLSVRPPLNRTGLPPRSPDMNYTRPDYQHPYSHSDLGSIEESLLPGYCFNEKRDSTWLNTTREDSFYASSCAEEGDFSENIGAYNDTYELPSEHAAFGGCPCDSSPGPGRYSEFEKGLAGSISGACASSPVKSRGDSPCSNGTYNASNSSGGGSSCPNGTYNASNSSGGGSPCPNGTYNASNSSGGGSPCPNGTYNASNSSGGGSPCPNGTYNASNSSGGGSPCPNKTSNACNRQNVTFNTPNSSRGASPCLSNTYNASSRSNATCSQGSSRPSSPSRGRNMSAPCGTKTSAARGNISAPGRLSVRPPLNRTGLPLRSPDMNYTRPDYQHPYSHSDLGSIEESLLPGYCFNEKRDSTWLNTTREDSFYASSYAEEENISEEIEQGAYNETYELPSEHAAFGGAPCGFSPASGTFSDFERGLAGSTSGACASSPVKSRGGSPCGNGTYNASNSSGGGSPCANGTYNASNSSRGGSPCPNGTYNASNSSRGGSPCGNGTYNASSRSNGTFSQGSSSPSSPRRGRNMSAPCGLPLRSPDMNYTRPDYQHPYSHSDLGSIEESLLPGYCFNEKRDSTWLNTTREDSFFASSCADEGDFSKSIEQGAYNETYELPSEHAAFGGAACGSSPGPGGFSDFERGLAGSTCGVCASSPVKSRGGSPCSNGTYNASNSSGGGSPCSQDSSSRSSAAKRSYSVVPDNSAANKTCNSAERTFSVVSEDSGSDRIFSVTPDPSSQRSGSATKMNQTSDRSRGAAASSRGVQSCSAPGNPSKSRKRKKSCGAHKTR